MRLHTGGSVVPGGRPGRVGRPVEDHQHGEEDAEAEVPSGDVDDRNALKPYRYLRCRVEDARTRKLCYFATEPA